MTQPSLLTHTLLKKSQPGMLAGSGIMLHMAHAKVAGMQVAALVGSPRHAPAAMETGSKCQGSRHKGLLLLVLVLCMTPENCSKLPQVWCSGLEV